MASDKVKLQIKNLRKVFENKNGDDTVAVDDVSFSINEGETLGVVGESGCGKSTLLRLLLGFEKPQKGAIYYDRKDISRVDMKSLRQKIGTVMQKAVLFKGTIRNNLKWGNPEATDEDIWEALSDRYLNIGCSVMMNNKNRFELLGSMIDEYKADGVLEMTLQACHTYNVEHKAIEKFCREEKGTPYFAVETDYSEADIAQLNTRIAAFIEML